MKKVKFLIALFSLTLILSLVGITAQAQCAMCKSSVESSNAGNNPEDRLARFGSGLNKGILYLMAIPYVLAGTVGFLWYRNNRK